MCRAPAAGSVTERNPAIGWVKSSTMTHHIQIQGTDYRFLQQGSETLLEAAMNAGVPVNYGCSNGNCGECAARAVDGRVERVRHSDHVFGAGERAAGCFLMCTHQAATDLVIEADTADRSSEIPCQEMPVKIRNVQPVNDEVTLLDVQTPRTQRLRFLAGQWARLAHRNGANCELPIASCPCDDRNLQFHLPVSGERREAILGLLQKGRGDSLTLTGPSGDFVLDHGTSRPRIMIGSGFGFPPLKSIIEHSLALQPEVAIQLVWLEPPGCRHYMDNHMRMWHDALDNLTLHRVSCMALSGSEPTGDFIDCLQSLADQRSDVYIAGPRELNDFVVELVQESGVPPHQVRQCII